MSKFKIGDKVTNRSWMSGYIVIEWMGDGCICGQLIEPDEPELCSPRVYTLTNEWIFYIDPEKRPDIPEKCEFYSSDFNKIIDCIAYLYQRLDKGGE